VSEACSGFVKWGDWALGYGVFGTEGLSLVDGYFKGQPVFNKLSLPVIRVKYVIDESLLGLTAVAGTGCGPYNDQITWDTEDFGENLNPISGPHHLVKVQCPGGDRYLCTEEIDVGGVPHLRLGVYARIGAYHIAQTWTLGNDGSIRPRVSSKGLSCDVDHWHHPYWRFDFALGMPEMQRVSVHQSTGAKIADITMERRVVDADFGRDIQYRITSTHPPEVGFIERPAMATIIPPMPNDVLGIVGPTPFAPLDGYVRKYRASEDASWPHKPEDDISFGPHDPVNDEDIVFWQVCHLEHHASEGKDHWHTVGPDIVVQPMIVAAVPPEALRSATIDGKVDVKDFGVFKDEWAHDTLSEKVEIDPNTRHQVVVKKVQQGDVTAEAIVHLDWHPDLSLGVHLEGNLFDELERVAHFDVFHNVPRDQAAVLKIHLVDYHGGDPDTGDIEVTVGNWQR